MLRRKRVNTATVLQMESVECGAACLAMILGYFRRYVSLEDLRVACGVSRNGTKAANILKAARQYGLQTRGFKMETSELRQVSLPAILFWNFNHFVVLEGFGRGRYYLNDPARGKVIATADEFDRSFTGVVLTFERLPEFKRGGRRPRLLRSLRERLPGSWLALAFLMLATLGMVVPGLVVPGFQRIFIDHVLIGGSRHWLQPLLWAMLAAALVKAVLTFLQQRVLMRLEMRLAIEGSSRFLRHALRLPIDFFLQRTAADVSARVAINDRVAVLLSGDLATSVVSLLTAAFYAAVMFQYDRLLAWVGIGIAFTNLAVLRWVSRRRVEGNERLERERGELAGVSINGLLAIETLKATGSESDFYARWSGIQAKLINREQSLNLISEITSSMPGLLLSLNLAILLSLGGHRVMVGALTMGALVAFQTLLISFLDPVRQLVQTGDKLPEAHAGMRRLDDVLRYPADPSLSDDIDPANCEKLEGYLELRDITFGYSRLETPLIEGFSLKLRPGQRVALVGGSGSGKSTVARLVAGIYRPWSGAVLFDGRPRENIPRAVVTSSVALVDQEIFLFQGTVRENIALWDDQLDEPSVIAAARDACIHDDIAARPGGYDSEVEEGGRNFSGGQRQRMEIARALTGNPRVLVLDEATSALDPKTELQVDDHLRHRGCTCLIVAHRLSTIRDCDEIIVMHQGRIVERGRHQQLMQANGHYAHLITSA